MDRLTGPTRLGPSSPRETPMTGRRLGLFGGTFDPPHNGHLALARAARAQLRLDQVLWLVTADPPHKQGQALTPVAVRLEMVAAVIAAEPPGALVAVGEEVLRAVGEDLPYARVDLVEAEGGPLLVEAELIEPELFLRTHPEAPDRFAAAVARRVRGGG